jgi:hypothetical protein
VTPSAVCIASGGDAIRFRSYINQAIYARERGFSYHLGIGLSRGARSPYEPKFVVIEEMLPHFEWVVWMDDDVYVTDMTHPHLETLLREAESTDAFLVLAEGPVETHGGWTRINTGVMALRNDPRTWELLADARAVNLGDLRVRWDADRFGVFTNGDQDTICWSLHAKQHLLAGTRIVSHRLLNSRPHYYEQSLEDAFAVHFCGAGDKMLRVAQFAGRFGLGQELVDEDLLDRWSVRRRDRMAWTELVARTAQERIRLFTRRVRRKVDFVRATRRWK